MNAPDTWPAKLREAAEWFDLIDKLLAACTIEDNEAGDAAELIDQIGAGREIQDDLLALARGIEKHDADREMGRCAAPIEFYCNSEDVLITERPDPTIVIKDPPPRQRLTTSEFRQLAAMVLATSFGLNFFALWMNFR